jgi:hypothetical protein|tara:strand:+ start:1666 stop:2271 length:606 start_codon:yes stop_codon:yes gene_type:complete
VKTIDEILATEIIEDKSDNPTTTSFKFKKDLYNFFKDFTDKVAVEFGTHKGQTTRILSMIFKTIYTVNNNDNASAKQLNSDKNNIIYLNNNLYSSEILDVPDKVSMFFVDAGHKYEQVVYDINRIFEMNCSEECYIVFDDYGGEGHRDHVKRAVDEGLAMGVIEHVKDIGYPAGHDFGTNVRTGKLIASEGIITKIKWTDI